MGSPKQKATRQQSSGAGTEQRSPTLPGSKQPANSEQPVSETSSSGVSHSERLESVEASVEAKAEGKPIGTMLPQSSSTLNEADESVTQTTEDTTITTPETRSPPHSPHSVRSPSQPSKQKATSSPELPESALEGSPQRRNAKRKAAAMSTLGHHAPSMPTDILDDALKPMERDELENWEGWVELESEPSFFSKILIDLGVRDVKIQEVFSLDVDHLGLIPKPVYGFIFLYQYVDESLEVDERTETDHIWFANQTVDNACATVAMLNIIMNGEGIELGDKLKAFKDSTMNMNTALRGHMLSKNKFIRTIHNGFTRRLDHFNADLWLDNKSRQKPKRRYIPTTKRQRLRKKKPDVDSGFHFIAYVPVGNAVWELDGLKEKPVKIGKITSADWTISARPAIQARMDEYVENTNTFNLLALCHSPLTTLSTQLAQTLKPLYLLEDKMSSHTEWTTLAKDLPIPLPRDDASKLSEYALTTAEISTAPLLKKVETPLSDPDLTVLEATNLRRDLLITLKDLMVQYRDELTTAKADEVRVRGRKKDYNPAILTWLRRLAEGGVLEELAMTTGFSP